MSETIWMLDEQKFKLKFGKANNNWDTVKLDPSVDTDKLHDGVYLAENPENPGFYIIAEDGAVPAYPMLEMKYQYDNGAVEGVTVSIGAVVAYTKHFDGTPENKDYLKVVDGKLVPISETDGDTKDDAVARVNFVYSDYIEITKLF